MFTSKCAEILFMYYLFRKSVSWLFNNSNKEWVQKQFNLANGCLNLNEWFDLVFFLVQSSIKEVLFIHLC